MTGYDIIGDVHGCADKLKTLLKKLGYVERDGAYRHTEDRQVVFVGDLIDRGLFQLEAVAIPRAMVERGTAQMVIGNHEFNAVAFATRNTDDTDWCRPHTPKNRDQHQAFLDAVEFGSVTHRSILSWFMSLPLWLDLGGLRVVHACWDKRSIDHLAPIVGPGNTLTDQIVIDGTEKGNDTYDAIEKLIKGPEIHLGRLVYLDKGGHERRDARQRWWKSDATTLRDVALIPGSTNGPDGKPFPELPDTPVADTDRVAYDDDTPVVVGHYWETGTPTVLGPNAACVDYSAVNGGPLVAYQWDGETELTDDKFVSI